MPRPSPQTDPSEASKWDAWNAYAGLSRTEAKRRYISTLIATMHTYASQTQDARELVSELEFVWDQIKSQRGSSTEDSGSAGSPEAKARRLGVPGQPVGDVAGMSYASLGGSTRASGGTGRVGRSPGDNRRRGGDYTAEDEGRLRVLSPISQRDEEEALLEDELNEAASRASDPEDEDLPAATRRNRRWRRRMEQAVVKMTAEVAALREQLEARRLTGGHGRRNGGAWSWFRWLIWLVVRQVFWDAVLAAVALLWLKRRKSGPSRVEMSLRSFADGLQERVRWLVGVLLRRPLRLAA